MTVLRAVALVLLLVFVNGNRKEFIAIKGTTPQDTNQKSPTKPTSLQQYFTKLILDASDMKLSADKSSQGEDYHPLSPTILPDAPHPTHSSEKILNILEGFLLFKKFEPSRTKEPELLRRGRDSQWNIRKENPFLQSRVSLKNPFLQLHISKENLFPQSLISKQNPFLMHRYKRDNQDQLQRRILENLVLRYMRRIMHSVHVQQAQQHRQRQFKQMRTQAPHPHPSTSQPVLDLDDVPKSLTSPGPQHTGSRAPHWREMTNGQRHDMIQSMSTDELLEVLSELEKAQIHSTTTTTISTTPAKVQIADTCCIVG